MPFAWERLIGLIAERKIVPVIGQDLLQVKTPLGEMALYRFIALRAAERLGLEPPPPDAANPLHTVTTQHLENRGDWQEIYSTVCEVIGETESFEPPAALADLAAIEPFSLFVTTTVDPLLQRTLDQIRYGGEDSTRVLAFTPGRTRDLPDATYDSTVATVFHLFGRYSVSPDYAVTEEDTLEFMHLLQSDVKRPQNLFRELAQRDLLMLGNSFDDWVGRFFIRLTNQERVWVARSTQSRFVADERVRHDAGLLTFLRQSPSIKVYPDGNPTDFVAELRRRWEQRASRLAREGKSDPVLEITPGSVFVSYASEDRAFAKAIADALSARGLDVWFDRDELGSGDDFGRKIESAIDRCAVFVPVISKACGDSRRFFFQEWRAAIDVAKKASFTARFVMPVVIDDIAYDDERVPREFRGVHWERVAAAGPEPRWVEEVRKEVRAFRKVSMAGTG
ncbi:MAG TPA: toll/interleukin-1 receptor domain-containing protein [Thermoanaerobaculia bacterium]|nr:toll/interleukin-1 receptor domain-containing protein [Thermoanaerobaculia bacterium]